MSYYNDLWWLELLPVLISNYLKSNAISGSGNNAVLAVCHHTNASHFVAGTSVSVISAGIPAVTLSRLL